ncbi:MAG: tRNA (adenosine(37)-N6)-dimethylallyltransferase MiaA [candidate division Zixibacteria bacterium]|nr:tRNA (adenosine(37)-N6)-dimethylallyltransferase MiaA [Candidatus Tariuqbacter arcticus]
MRHLNEKPKIPVILGPTAAGKTAVGIAAAEAMNGEIVSADSRQIYRGMTIGTAKPSKGALGRVRHHLIDILEPDELFSAGEFVRRAMAAIEDIASRGKLPIVVGGAGLYIRALTRGIFNGESSDADFRTELQCQYEQGGSEDLLAQLRRIDPEYAGKVHLNDKKKLVRALEIYHTTGMTITELNRVQGDGWIEPISIGLELPRETLYERINQRVKAMIEAGLIEEVESLRSKGYGRDLNSINSPGYVEVYDYLDGNIGYDEIIELIKRNTRRYAKRQITWFRKEEGVRWVDVSKGYDDVAGEVIGYIKENLIFDM